MNISKDGKTLYFSDEEIDNDTNGEKKVFVTKRINGKESHVKAEKRKKIEKHIDNEKKVNEEDDEIFNFNSEMVLGVNIEEDSKAEKKKVKKRKKQNRKYTDTKVSEHKKQKRKKSKKKKVNKKIIGCFSIIVLIATIIILALTAPIFNITEITVQGNNKIPTNTIISLSELKKGENIFKFNNSVEKKIKENNYVENVKVQRKLPGKVIISIEERNIKYQVNLINSYVYIDKNGYILENSSEKKDVPVIVRFINNRR